MATYHVDAPDGYTYTIDGPDGADDATIAAAVLAQYPDSDKPPAPPPPPPKGLPDHDKFLNDAKTAAAKQKAITAKPVVPGPPPPPKARVERVGGNLLSGIRDAGEKVFGGLQEAAGYIPEGQKPIKFAGYDVPNAIAGGANVLNGLSRGIGALGMGALDAAGVAATPGAAGRSDVPLFSEAIGGAINAGIIDPIKHFSGSETPGEDTLKWLEKKTGTNRRFGELLLNAAGTAVGGRAINSAISGSTKAVGGIARAINAAIPTRISRAEALAKRYYSIPDVVYAPSVATGLQNKVDAILAEHNPSKAGGAAIRKVLQKLQDDVGSGAKPLTQDVLAEFKADIKKVKGEADVNPDVDFSILSQIEDYVKNDIMYNETTAAVSGNAARSAIARKYADKNYAKVATAKTAIQEKVKNYVNKNSIFPGEVKEDYIRALTTEALAKLKLKAPEAKVVVPRAETKARGRVVLGTRTGNALETISKIGSSYPASLLGVGATATALTSNPAFLGVAASALAGSHVASVLSNLSKARQFRRMQKETLKSGPEPSFPTPPPGNLTLKGKK